MRDDDPAPIESSARLRFAAGLLLVLAVFAGAVLAVDTLFIALALWHSFSGQDAQGPLAVDYLFIAAPLALQAVPYLVMIRFALRLWGPLMAGSNLARADVRTLAWICVAGTAVSGLLTAAVLVEGYADGVNAWLGGLGWGALIGIAVLFVGGIVIALATRRVPRRRGRAGHLRLVVTN